MVDGRSADKNEVGLLMATGGRESAAEGADPEAVVDPTQGAGTGPDAGSDGTPA